MRKTGLTFYLPQQLLKQIKIAAIKEKMTFSDMVRHSAQGFIDQRDFNPALPVPKEKSVKAFIYLYPKTKQTIKKAAAAENSTISNFLYQALSYYLANKHRLVLPRLEQPPQKSRRTAQQRENISPGSPFVYRLTTANENWIRMHAAETGKTRKEIIFEAVEKMDTPRFNNLKTASALDFRTSMKITEEEESYLRETAGKLQLSVNELINKALLLFQH